MASQCDSTGIRGAAGRLILYPYKDMGVVSKGVAIKGVPVAGLISWTLPGMTREVITDDDLERDFSGSLSGGGTYGTLSFSGSVRQGDLAHGILKGWLKNNTEIQADELKFIVNRQNGSFWAMDKARDDCPILSVTEYSYQEANKSNLLQFTGNLAVNGANEIFDTHSHDEMVYTIAAGVLTATGGTFVTDGFKSGMSVICETGVAANPVVVGVINSVTATTVTFEDGTIELASGTGFIHGSSDSVFTKV